MKAQVTRVIAGFYDLWIPRSNEFFYLQKCNGNLRKDKNSPLVGDYVDFEKEGFIYNIYPRKNFFTRPKVANIDKAIVCMSIEEPTFSSKLLDKFLLIIEQKQIEPIIIITKKDLNGVRQYSNQVTAAQLAEEVSHFSLYERSMFFRMLTTETAAEVFSYFASDIQEELIAGLPDEQMNALLEELYTDEIADLIEEVPDNVANKILKNIDKNTRNIVNLLLKYTDEQIGSIMSVDIVYLDENLSSKQALDKIRTYKDEAELVHYYYVVNHQKHIIGAITLEDIVFSDQNELVKDICFATPIVKTTDLKEKVAYYFAENDFSVLPVVNSKERLVGMITADDIIDIVQEEATEDMYKLAGISSKKIDDSYVKTTVLQIVKSRIFWLIILMLGSTLSQVIIQMFTDSIAQNQRLKVLGLSIFISTIVSIIPVISGAAGNAGSQSATTIVRAISLAEVERKNFFKQVFLKELAVGSIIGTILMVINFVRLLIYFTISKDLFNNQQPHYEIVTGEHTINIQHVHNGLAHKDYILIISAAASFSLFLVIIFSKMLGSSIPLLAQILKKDPAVMSAPILATLTDSVSTFIFFGITILVFVLI
ncbi:magnesium transporter [Mesomycoplasma hyorhinis]|uniref:magnesium transporter n=1 Tax=Mesomycoplasma hyorhinis TaxID=2100 RepID=UPI001C052633|nr:magnesium transporter [Mesomycoplasma hyorhinis]